MNIPFDKITGALKTGFNVSKESNTPVRVAVYLDYTASQFLIDTVREALVPQTTSGIVRVERLGDDPVTPKNDNDVVLILSCGSDRLQSAVQEIVVAGAPVAVITESAVEASFIASSTPMLGNIAATDKTHLLESLAHFILERTEKSTAFAANFPFMRIAAANKVISNCVFANAATGALFFIPGADTPVMLAAQVGMLFELASIFGKPLAPERGYEVAGVIAAGFVLRTITRFIVKRTPHIEFLVKALVAAGGSFAMGKGLCYLYQQNVDYTRANEVLGAAFGKTRDIVTAVAGAAKASNANAEYAAAA